MSSKSAPSPIKNSGFIGIAEDQPTMQGILTQYPHVFDRTPVHLLVPNRTVRRHSSIIQCHSCEQFLPRGSFWQINPEVLISSPELSFLQMAMHLTTVQLAEFGMNLCSTFYINQAESLLGSRTTPLTTPDEINRYIMEAEGAHGRKHAQRCLKLVNEGSASPMETKLFINLCFPLRLGGYGLPKAVLNYRIEPKKGRRYAEQQFYVADLCWPNQKVIVEYDGLQYHENSSKDKRRTNALESLGWKVFCITKAEMFNATSFEVLAMQIAKALGHRIRRSPTWQNKAIALRSELSLTQRHE